VRRISVVGNSGAGKSTLADALAARLGVPHVELDAHFHLPGWQTRDIEDFSARVADALAGDCWVADGNYSKVREQVWARVDTIVWLDLSRWVVTHRIVRRSIARAITRRELWQGNRESWRALLSRDAERSIIRWSWTHQSIYRQQFGELLAPGTQPPGVTVVRLTSPRQVRRWLAELG
jgi:adenylate kinase family enzyme